ncbi:SIR2 family histone deacetylase [Lecanosticta acicola]|uniref:SIR2 family histone deacetylase n=1 Tax=Lecanosticta acicola TaxID=111012 RepID=A0AAI9EEH6_9PEZI|nr:SIR2 family histone deacetylase [Lecanosticta acicola]
MRIPYTAPLPSPTIFPASASTVDGAVEALQNFLAVSPSKASDDDARKTLILSGAGISVASGLADYRGSHGTYTLNKTYRPIYFHEFSGNHEARKRYWARSFLGWTNLHRSKPNAAHHAVGQLGDLGIVSRVVTQNVDSFHNKAHPNLRTLELHGYLRSTVCLTCRTEYDRDRFQDDLSRLNPAWAAFLAEMLESGALTTEDPHERRRLGLKTNPDGDVDVPGVDYNTFKYPACPKCLHDPKLSRQGDKVLVDGDGAWAAGSTAGVLKPAVIMFGESIPNPVKAAAESAIDEASRLLVLGSSLATYSAWRIAKRAREQGKPIAAVNMGGLRGEENFFADVPFHTNGKEGVRCDLPLETTMPALVESLTHAQRRGRVFQPAPWA